MRLRYLEDIDRFDLSEFENASDAFVAENLAYFKKNTCAMLMNAEPDLLKRACIFAVYSDSGAYQQYALQYLLRAGYPRSTNERGQAFFEAKTYTEINFWINFYSVLSQRLINKTREYFEKEREKLPLAYIKMFEYIYGKIEEDYF